MREDNGFLESILNTSWLSQNPGLEQQFPTGVQRAFFKHAVPDYIVRGIDLFFLRLSKKEVATDNTTIAIQGE